MSECDENIVQYRVREMLEDQRRDFLLWAAQEFPREWEEACMIVRNRVKEK